MNLVNKSSHFIRNEFIDYFKKCDHSFIRSSPVVPFCDPSLSFVNAGMNQFKNVLLGREKPPSKRVVNSQKCVRVGGKHNDLMSVGHDTYHHTFFEMLGNWSFNDYYKKEACAMAWTFLTSNSMGIPPDRLLVTYFNGDEQLGLPPDLETKEIWLSIGVNKNRILPFGFKDNFWEMGQTGPCGPCTEIHYINRKPSSNGSFMGDGIATELWNIVFINGNRLEGGKIEKLANHNVDTGMGFERLVSIIQGKHSNYDTDLFLPLFDTIAKVSGAPPYKGKFGDEDKNGLDTAYRILADHTRLSVIALTDNMFPDQNHKLRRVIRKALSISEKVFDVKCDHKLVREAAIKVCEILSSAYPEISRNINKVNLILEEESERIKELKNTSAKEWDSIAKKDRRVANVFDGVESVGLPSAYKEIVSWQISGKETGKRINGDLALKLYDTYGLDVDLISDFAYAMDLKFNQEEFHNKLAMLKKTRMDKKMSNFFNNSPIQEYSEKLSAINIPCTNDVFKYIYENNNNGSIYSFPEVNAKVEAVVWLDSGFLCTRKDVNLSIQGFNNGDKVAVVLDATNFYTESGGQCADKGLVIFIDNVTSEPVFTLNVEKVLKESNFVFHCGVIASDNNKKPINIFDIKAILKIDVHHRQCTMRNHTTIHLINYGLENLLTITCQRSSSARHDCLDFDFSIYTENFDRSSVVQLESIVRKAIQCNIPIHRKIIDQNRLLSYNKITLLPGEYYTDSKISIIEIMDNNNNKLVSREPCCGTHLLNTSDIGEFCIINLKSKRSNIKSVRAITGHDAKLALNNDKRIKRMLNGFDETMISLAKEKYVSPEKLNSFQKALDEFTELLANNEEFKYISYYISCDAFDFINDCQKKLNILFRRNIKQLLDYEIKNAVQVSLNRGNYFVHLIESCADVDSDWLMKATKMCPTNIPVMLFTCSNDNILKARCSVPQYLCEKLPAERWIEFVCEEIGGKKLKIKEQDSRLVCGMRSKKLAKDKPRELINKAINIAEVAVQKIILN